MRLRSIFDDVISLAVSAGHGSDALMVGLAQADELEPDFGGEYAFAVSAFNFGLDGYAAVVTLKGKLNHISNGNPRKTTVYHAAAFAG